MEHVDGNALAGPLSEYFRVDVTTAVGRCAGCGDVAQVARAMVYPDEMGFVVRCSRCDQVLMTLVNGPDRSWLDLSGVSNLQLPSAPQ
ncbi:MAG: DUF6510 family protein [Glaciihabitans sp.]